MECKSTYLELSKVVQGVLASRKELVKYDQKKAELGAVPSSEPSTPAVLSTPLGSDEVSFGDLFLSLTMWRKIMHFYVKMRDIQRLSVSFHV